MPVSRVFVPQEALESWLSLGRVHMVGETLFVDGHAFALEGAVHFTSEVTGGPDEHQLLGRVQTMGQLSALGGEHVSASVVLGENAYEVVDGFLAKAEASTAKAATHDKLIELFANR